MKLPGHWLDVRWNGEYGAESASTGTCVCGWTESASTQREVRREYQDHLSTEAAKLTAKAPAEPGQGPVVGLSMSAAAAAASLHQAVREFARLADELAQGKIVLTDYQRTLVYRSVNELADARDQAEGLVGRIAEVVK